MNFFLVIFSFIFIVGCGSTKVKNLSDKEFLPLSENEEVVVFIEKEPTFRFKKICEIKVNRKGSWVSTNRADYKENIEKEARKCGAKYAIVQSLSGYSVGDGKNITITGYGIKKISSPQTLKLEDGKKLINASQLNNKRVIETILSSKSTPKTHKKRSKYDQTVLSLVLANATKEVCQKDVIDTLVNKYDVRVMDGKEMDRFFLKNIFRCPKVVKKSFKGFKDRVKLFTAFNNYFAANSQENDKMKVVLPLFQSEAKKACKKSKTDEICIFAPRLEEFKKRKK